MISVTEHIRYLLTCHDCVIVPGWGAFVSQYIGARLSDDGLKVLPPSRILGFNPDVAHNDGLLASSIARREGISYDAATALIANDVSMYFHRVDVLGELVMPRVGRFVKSSNGAMLFEPDADAPVVAACYAGLPEVAVRAIDSQSDEAPVILPVAPRRRSGFAPLRIAASVAVLLGMGVLLSTPVLVDGDAVDQASLLTTVTAPKVQNVDVARLVAIPSDSTLRFTIPAADLESSSVEVRKNNPDSYHCFLVVASCETRRRAERYIASTNEAGLRILERDGRFRVYAAAANSVAEAMRLKLTDSAFAERHPDAWVYVR